MNYIRGLAAGAVFAVLPFSACSTPEAEKQVAPTSIEQATTSLPDNIAGPNLTDSKDSSDLGEIPEFKEINCDTEIAKIPRFQPTPDEDSLIKSACELSNKSKDARASNILNIILPRLVILTEPFTLPSGNQIGLHVIKDLAAEPPAIKSEFSNSENPSLPVTVAAFFQNLNIIYAPAENVTNNWLSGSVLIHEFKHGVEDIESDLPEETRALVEASAYELQFKLIEEVGGDEYLEYLNEFIEKGKSGAFGTNNPADFVDSDRVMKILGPVTENQRIILANLFYLNSRFKYADQVFQTDAERMSAKTAELMNLGITKAK